jgi:hypothetical protein
MVSGVKNEPPLFRGAADGEYAPRFLSIFLALVFFSVSMANPPSHPPQLTQAVGLLENNI